MRKRLFRLGLSLVLILVVILGVSVEFGGPTVKGSKGIVSLSVDTVLAAIPQFTPNPPAPKLDLTPGEVVSARTLTSRTDYLGGGKYSLDSSIGAVHYKDTQGNWQNINNTLSPATAPWNWQMTAADYQVRFLSQFNFGQIAQFSSQNQTVTFQPMNLEWRNDLDQIQSISAPRNVAVSVTNPVTNILPNNPDPIGTIKWVGAYGTGIDFQWECAPTELAKTLTVNSMSNLPVPTQTIINGGNASLTLTLYFAFSSGVNPYVDGVPWDKKSKVTTFNAIEFRNASGQVLWDFMPLMFWDSSGNNTSQSVATLNKSGPNLYIQIRVPYSWLQTALFPVYIDANVDVQVGVSDDDGYIVREDSGSYTKTATQNIVGYNPGLGWHYDAWDRFTGITIAQSSTIDVAYLTVYEYNSDNSGVLTKIWADDQSNPSYPTTTANYTGRTVTTAGVEWNGDPGNNDWHNTPSIVSVIQELVNSYDYSNGAIQILHKDNGSSGSPFRYNRSRTWDYAGNIYGMKLHIEYSGGVVDPTVVTGAATSITTTTASIAENVTATGGGDVSSWGTEYGTTTSYGSNVTNSGNHAAAFGWTDNLSSLSSNTTYFYRGFATNTHGTGYGTGANFTTLSLAMTNAPASVAFGVVLPSTTYWSYTGNTTGPPNPIDDAHCKFTITNTGTAAINVTVSSTNFTGGTQWTLGSPASMVVQLTVFKSGDNTTSGGVVLTNSPQSFISALAASGTKKWDLKMETPTAFTDGAGKTATITLTASAS